MGPDATIPDEEFYWVAPEDFDRNPEELMQSYDETADDESE
jgi:hypothetical protein